MHRMMSARQPSGDTARCCGGSLRGPVSDTTRSMDMRVAGSCRVPCGAETRAIVEALRPGQTVGSSPDASVVFNMGRIGRTHGQAASAAPLPGGPASGAASGTVSPSGPGGMPLGVPRTGSFSGYPVAQSPARPSVAMPLRQASSAAACRPQQGSSDGRCGGMPPAGTTGLEISQRMARANELQRRLASSPQQAGPHASFSPPISLNTPSLLNWAKEAAEQGQFRDGDPIGLGLDTLHNLPPPPRSAPAVDAMPASRGGGRTADSRDPRCVGGRGSSGGGGGGGSRHALTVLTSENRWETLTFLSNGNLEQQARDFLAQKGLKAAFISGLLSKMKSMVSTGQAQSSVDIVDLI